MTELSKVTSVKIIDGYGRTYTSDKAAHITFTIMDDGQTLKITHDGDTRTGLNPEQLIRRTRNDRDNKIAKDFQ